MFEFKKKFTIFYVVLCFSIIVIEITAFEVFAQTVDTVDSVDSVDNEGPIVCDDFPRCKKSNGQSRPKRPTSSV